MLSPNFLKNQKLGLSIGLICGPIDKSLWLDPWLPSESLRHLFGGLTGFSGSLKISLCEDRQLEDTESLSCRDRKLQNCLVSKTVDLAA